MNQGPTRRALLKQGGLAALAVSGLGALTACGSSQSAGAQHPNKIAGASGSVSYWVSAQGANRPVFESFIAEFHDAYPKITIDVSYRPLSTAAQQVRTALAAGHGPDLVNTGGPSSIGSFVTADLFLPLDDYATAQGWDKKLLPWALDSGKLKGHFYAVPTSFETIFFFTNDTVFQQEGYQPPTNRSEFEALCADIASSGRIPITSGNSEFQGLNTWWVTFGFNHVAGPDATYRALTGDLPWTDDAFVASMDTVVDYFKKGWIAGGVKPYFTTVFDTMYNQLATGKAAMFLSGSWDFVSMTDPFKQSGMQYGWVPLPSIGEDVSYPIYDIGIGSTISINKNSANPDAAAAYLDWQISDRKEMLAFVAKTDGEPMPVQFTVDDFPPGFNQQEAAQYAALIKASNEGNFGYTLWTFWSAKGQDYLTKNFDNLIAGSMSSQDFLSGFDQIHQADLQAGLVPPALPRIS